MLSLTQLKSETTRSSVLSWLISKLAFLGFQTTGWQPGRIQQSILSMAGDSGASVASVAGQIAEGSFSSTATGAMLTLVSASHFDNVRVAAVKTAGPFTFTSAATGPYVVQVGQLIISDSQGVKFTNTTGGTIPAGSSLVMQVEAILGGSSGNIGNLSTLTLLTPLAGVTVTNPASSGLPWYTTTGADEESNAELRQRNSTKWGLLAVEKTKTALENLAIKQTGVAKVRVVDTNPRGPNTTDIYVSAASALVSGPEIAAAQAAFATYTSGTESVWPPTHSPYQSVITLYHPSTLTLTLQGTVYYDPRYTQAEVEAELTARLDAFVELLPIGGKTYASGAANLVTVGDLLEVIEGTAGVLSCTLTTPAGNVLVSPSALVVPPASWTGAGALIMTAGIA
jgi:uncharacterized phage protein gp47/JayE